MLPEEDGGPPDGTAVDYEALSGIADDPELGEMTAQLAPLHPKHNTFAGDVLLEPAGDAIEEAGATRQRPLEFEGIRSHAAYSLVAVLAERGDLDGLRREVDAGTTGALRALREVEFRGDAPTG